MAPANLRIPGSFHHLGCALLGILDTSMWVPLLTAATGAMLRFRVSASEVSAGLMLQKTSSLERRFNFGESLVFIYVLVLEAPFLPRSNATSVKVRVALGAPAVR